MKKEVQILMKLLRFAVLSVFLLITLIPFYWTFVTSLKGRLEIHSEKLTLWPLLLTFDNYIAVFQQSHLSLYLKNSLIVTFISSAVVIVISVLGGYALARYKFKGKGVMLLIFLGTQMIPIMIILVPLFVIFSSMGLIDNLWSLIVCYTVINIPFCLVTMSSFFKRVPVSLEEAASIDGCGKLEAVARVILPVMLPGIVATFVFAFTGAWNELFFGVMFINSESFRTIPVGLNNFIQKYDIDWGQMSAGGIVSLIPVVIMFMLVQKYMVAGLTQGAVKG